MKKRSLKNLSLNKESISNIQTSVFGRDACSSDTKTTSGADPFTTTIVSDGPLPLTANIRECPDNSLAGDCSLGHCPETFWCA